MVSQFGFVWNWGYGFFKILQKWLFLSWDPLDDTDDVKLDTWLKECLPGFSTIKLLFFFFFLRHYILAGLYAAVGSCCILLPCPIHGSLNLTLPSYFLDCFPNLVLWSTIHCNIAHTWWVLKQIFCFTFEILRIFLDSGQMLLPL